MSAYQKWNSSNLEAQDDGPYESEGEPVVSINYIMRTYVF